MADLGHTFFLVSDIISSNCNENIQLKTATTFQCQNFHSLSWSIHGGRQSVKYAYHYKIWFTCKVNSTFLTTHSLKNWLKSIC